MSKERDVTKSTWGGKREGSGRPMELATRGVTKSVIMDEATINVVNDFISELEESGVSFSDGVRRLIRSSDFCKSKQ